MDTASTAFIEALNEAGVACVFANFGSDHAAILEAIAAARIDGAPVPKIVTCPNEMVAMTAAQGYAQVTGRPQAVLVHVECGTQALAGAVHNAARARVPMLVFAGASPFTQNGELPGSRNEFIQWLQDVHDQRGIVRGYMKYDGEVRTGANIKQMVHRAMQIAGSDPAGPVYLMAAREVMQAPVERAAATDMAHWRPVAQAPLPEDAVETILSALEKARRPLIVTTYIGRRPAAVADLVRFAESLGIGVLESVPSTMNFPADHPLHQGNQWNEQRQNAALAAADCVLVIDSDVPWIPSVSHPDPAAAIYHIDIDPLKEGIPVWHIDARLSLRADATTALKQLNGALARRTIDRKAVEERHAHYAEESRRHRAGLDEREAGNGARLTVEQVLASIRRHVDAETIVLNEGITNYSAVCNHMLMREPGSYFASGGGSLGWNGGAAIGAKLAAPHKTIVALTGDGSYMFSVPSSVHWMARRYETPFLQVIFNNGGWHAPRFSALSVDPDGHVSRTDDLDLSFEPSPDYGAIAAASGDAFARKITRPDEVDRAVCEAFDAVRKDNRTAVLDVCVQQASRSDPNR